MPISLDGCRAIAILTFLNFPFLSQATYAQAQPPKQKPSVEIVEVVMQQAAAPQPPSDSELYCKNIASAASDARVQWQTWKMISLEARLRDRIAELKRREKKFEDWVERRENLLNEVEDQVVNIIGRMRPEAAAAQLSTTEEEAAVGVLMKLKARVASSILDEMDPARAAQLTQSMMGFTDPEAQRSF
ncbi:MAG: MotE family protein [Roseibium sp.]